VLIHGSPQSIDPCYAHSINLPLNLETTLKPSGERLSMQTLALAPMSAITIFKYALLNLLPAPD
jgi:hypothetical protein